MRRERTSGRARGSTVDTVSASTWQQPRSVALFGRRVMLRPLTVSDFEAWREVRVRCRDWLTVWEPSRVPGSPDPTTDRDAFGVRCAARQRERALGSGFGFGVFHEGRFRGEINLNTIQRGPFQNAYVGYWIDEQVAGLGLMPESVVVLARFAFEELGLHRIQISIIPRNAASRRVPDKLGIRSEGVAERYLEINGVWEDHVRYAMTADEWVARRDELERTWLAPPG